MSNFSEIKKSLLNFYPFTEEQLQLFTSQLQQKKLSKKAFLVQPNQVSDCIYFINSGSLRLYIKTEDTDQTITFFTETAWVADVESLLAQQPGKTYIEAYENSDLFLITLKDIHRLIALHPCFQMLNSMLSNFIIPTAYIKTINTKSPDERYDDLLSKKPEWINRFPQMYIASYLGITPETLSRVRARIK